MKTRHWQTALTILALCALSSHAAEPQDSTPLAGETNVVSSTPSPSEVIVAPPTNVTPPADQAPTNPPPATPNSFPRLTLPPLLDQVVRLNQSGTDESVVRAYIEKAAPAYQITGNEIIQLQDLGVPRSVILALIEHSKTVPSAAPNVPPPETQVVAPPPAQATDDAPAGSAEAAADFREPLAPYGTWMDVPGYGYCWQPAVVVVNPSWHPYSDYGDWRWSDAGWYWNSYYSWGWAPFHYGRWFTYPGRGWLWCPDRVWGPAWVSWRNSDTHCGWAPLPPGACYSGEGWKFGGVSVGVDFSFGLDAAHFTFVAHSRFSERHVGLHAVRGQAASSHYRNTTVLNNYAAGPNNRVVNHGVSRHQIAAASQTPIRQVSATELPRAGQRIAAPTGRISLARTAGPSTAHRSVASVAQRNVSGSATAPSLPGERVGGRAVAQRNLSGRPAAQPVFSQRTSLRTAIVAGGGSSSRAMPNYSQGFANRMNTPQLRQSVAMPAQRAAAAPRYQPRANARPAPARSFNATPSSTQRAGGARTVQRSLPTSGGGSRAALPRGGGGGRGSARNFGARQ